MERLARLVCWLDYEGNVIQPGDYLSPAWPKIGDIFLVRPFRGGSGRYKWTTVGRLPDNRTEVFVDGELEWVDFDKDLEDYL